MQSLARGHAGHGAGCRPIPQPNPVAPMPHAAAASQAVMPHGIA